MTWLGCAQYWLVQLVWPWLLWGVWDLLTSTCQRLYQTLSARSLDSKLLEFYCMSVRITGFMELIHHVVLANEHNTSLVIQISSLWQTLWPDSNRSTFWNTVFCLENRLWGKSINPVIHNVTYSSHNASELRYISDFFLRMDPKMIEKLLTWTMLLQPIRNGWMLIHLKWCWWIWGIASHLCKQMKVKEEMKGREKPQPSTAGPVSSSIGQTCCV